MPRILLLLVLTAVLASLAAGPVLGEGAPRDGPAQSPGPTGVATGADSSVGAVSIHGRFGIGAVLIGPEVAAGPHRLMFVHVTANN